MNAVLVSIGDEILIGQVTDTNSVWIAQQLIEAGIDVVEMVSISDKPAHISSTLDRFVGKTDIVLLTGGLGPTKDDLTKNTLTEYFEGKLIVHQETLDIITEYFRRRGRKMIDSNRDQSLVPDNCRVIPNDRGTAPGMWFIKENTHIISMPGVPYEMKSMMTNHVLPGFHKELDVPALVQKTVMTIGMPESYLAETIKEWEANLPDCMKLAYLPRPGIVRLRLTATGKCAQDASTGIDAALEELDKIIGEYIFAHRDIMLEARLGEMLTEMGSTLSTAESCTGGNIARLLTSVPGSSAYFKGSVIAYSNEVKTSLLHVDPKLLDEHGAVSGPVVEQMAASVRKVAATDYSLAVSGIAGPDGGSGNKPVGTVWIAVADESGVESLRFVFGGHRQLVIEQASIAALGMLWNRIQFRNN